MSAHTNWPASAPGIPPDANVYTFSVASTLIFLLAMLMAATEATLLFVHAWTTADPTTRITQIPEGVFFALVAELNWRFLRSSRTRVAVNDQGIWCRQSGRNAFLAWNEVASVRANDALQRLEIADGRDVTTIRVEYQIGNFNRLRDFILSHTARQAQVEQPGMSVFHASLGNKIVYASIAAILFFFAWLSQHHSGHLLIVPLMLGFFALYMVLRDPIRVVIGHDALAILHFGFQRDIPFNSIANVSLSDVRFRGNVWAGVVITTRRGARIRLSGFREGSVALFEALQAARNLAAAAQGSPLAGSPSPPATINAPQPVAPAAPHIAPTRRTAPAAAPRTRLAFGVVIFTALIIFFTLARTPAGKALGEAIASRVQIAPMYPLHRGPVAPLSALHGSGTVYLVQMGDHPQPYSLADFAQSLHAKYSIDVQVLPPMAINRAAWDAGRGQFVAEQLYAQIKQRYPDLAQNRNAFLIGFTDSDMYSGNNMWSSTFTQRDHLRAAIISSDGMGDTAWQRANLPASTAGDRFRDRMRRILLKDVAMLYWHLPLNNDPSSLLHDPLDPDLPVDDIFASDLDPALSTKGARVYEPCVFFTYSARDGIAPLPGPLVRSCGDIENPMKDESVEVFEVDIRLGLLIDKHTDLYLPDTIPIQFQRATRDGGYGKQAFGVSGRDYYEEVLGSADNVHVFAEESDGTREDMIRVPEWLPVLPLVKYVGGDNAQVWVPSAHGGSYRTAWQYQLAWHALPYEQYNLQRFNGEMKTFLPCSGTPGLDCVLVDYYDSLGHELRIERDKLRRLSRITSPNGSWVGVATDDDRRILAVDDNKGRTVLYGYDAASNLVSVTYPSGEVYHYTYDDTQHILSVAVSADAHTEPRIVLRNEYANKMLTKMTLADGSVYTFDYDSADRMNVHHAAIRTPDGRIFTLDIGDPWATVHETPAPATTAAK